MCMTGTFWAICCTTTRRGSKATQLGSIVVAKPRVCQTMAYIMPQPRPPLLSPDWRVARSVSVKRCKSWNPCAEHEVRCYKYVIPTASGTLAGS